MGIDYFQWAIDQWKITGSALDAAKIEVEALKEALQLMRSVVSSMWVHAGYPNCGYQQMTHEEKGAYDEMTGAPASENAHLRSTETEFVIKYERGRAIAAHVDAVLGAEESNFSRTYAGFLRPMLDDIAPQPETKSSAEGQS